MKTGEKVIVGAAAATGVGLILYGIYKLIKPPEEPKPGAEVTLSWN